MSGTIAVVGASADRSKYGNKCVRAYLQAGYRVFPVNPRGDPIEGLETWRSLSEIRSPLDRISVYLPPERTARLLPEIARAGAGEVWLNPGSSDARVRRLASELGVPLREGCSIVDIGLSPSQFA